MVCPWCGAEIVVHPDDEPACAFCPYTAIRDVEIAEVEEEINRDARRFRG